ncbi:MAG: Coenzyme F420 hydrogenase/dehydrogenase, beta subunit C-terminal domain [Chitinispirillaceae bacterium]|nr:Coenzyme F420 hydrogenase/dehydrogenase, beta subunit C-terminal domain [Chitinispirillaceae bacterium]
MPEDIKSFHDLITEVQQPGFCGRCGGCVSFCSAGELNALRISRENIPEFADETKCLKCGICYLICPQVKALDGDVAKKFGWKQPVGYFRLLRSAKTRGRTVARRATDGGVVTSLLLYALKHGMIDGAVVARETGPFARAPEIATTERELTNAAGSHYDDGAQLSKVGKSYSSFVPAIREVRELTRHGMRRVAFVGTPCQVRALRKMQLLKVVPSDIVTMVIGLFCMENFSFGTAARKKLEKQLGISLEDVVKLNVKDDVIMTMSNGEALHVPFELMDDVARPACFACSDFSNEFADISCGGLGSPDGYTTVMVRTSVGETIYNRAKREGFIREMVFKSPEASRIHHTTMMAKIVSFSRRKRRRASEARTLPHA